MKRGIRVAVLLASPLLAGQKPAASIPSAAPAAPSTLPAARPSSPVALHAPAAPSASSAAPAGPFPTLRGADLPTEESKTPTAAEWSTGKRIAPTRGTAERCELTLVREWLKVRCPGMAGVGLVAGDPRGVSARVLGRLFIDGMDGDVAAIAVLPVRRGDARIVAFNDVALEYDSSALAEGGVLSVLWRANRPDPVLVMRGFPKAPARPGAP